MLAALAQPGLPVVTGVQSERDVWRVRMALAHAGRALAWVACDPKVAIAGARVLDARLADWDEATERLREAGCPHPALLAAWLDLDPARIEAARAGQLDAGSAQGVVSEADAELKELLTKLRELGDETPSWALVDALVERGFTDVAMALALLRWQRRADDDAGELVQWLLALGHTNEAEVVAAQWVERAKQSGEGASLAAAWTAWGDINVLLGKSDAALRCFEDALAGLRVLVGREPDRADLQRNLAVVRHRLGNIHFVLGNGRKVKPPMWAHQIVLDTVSETNEDGTWFNYNIEFAVENNVKASILPPGSEAYQAAKELNQMVSGGVIKADEANATEDAGGAAASEEAF